MSQHLATSKTYPAKGGVADSARFRFVCPGCRERLRQADRMELVCPTDRTTYRQVAGIWHFLEPRREQEFERFVSEYEAIRRLEGRGSHSPDYYLALPYRDLTGRYSNNWKIRARSFRLLLRRVVAESDNKGSRPLTIVDLGAGNCWMSYRLAAAGHRIAAVDLSVNKRDGLGAHVHYPVELTPVRAAFDALPFEDGEFDVAVYNASVHYSTEYDRTLAEALRVLKPGGRIIILDSPVYRDASSGSQMVREREEAFRERYGFPSDALPSENFLTFDRLEELASTLRLRWTMHTPFYGVRWAIKPWKARLFRHREPARFMIIVGKSQ